MPPSDPTKYKHRLLKKLTHYYIRSVAKTDRLRDTDAAVSRAQPQSSVTDTSTY